MELNSVLCVTHYNVQTLPHIIKDDSKQKKKTDRQAVQDNVFLWWGRGGGCQGNRAVIG